MRRTISAEVGKGSVNHNSRKFNTKNTDPERTPLNIEYCNDNIKAVYHELFDEALEKYNEKQTRSDRRIEDYYEKIRSGKQEKPFHELIIQVGNRDDMSATGEHSELAKDILNEYYQGFQERNPNLRVFSAHLHMDEATPHLHIDFVPFTTGSKRGLETRVSLKQALAAEGFIGGSRSETEWNLWVQAEKECVAAIMAQRGIEWEHKGNEKEHLSVLDYKKQMRSEEVRELDEAIDDKLRDIEGLTTRIVDLENTFSDVSDLRETLDKGNELQLPEPQRLVSAKTYKKEIEPIFQKLKDLILVFVTKCSRYREDYERVNRNNGKLWRENDSLKTENDMLMKENSELRGKLKDYNVIKRVLGTRGIEEILKRSKATRERER